MTVAIPSSTNVFVPTTNQEASGALVVEFSRNPADFALARYAQIVPIKLSQGLYLEITAEQAARVVNSGLQNFEWPDGADRPEGNDELESFNFKPYAAARKAYAYNVGYLTAEQAAWDIVAQNGRSKAQLAMTVRTMKAMGILQTSGNYDATHTSDVASISGNAGKWDVSTTARQDIKRSINYASRIILADTLGVVRQKDLVLVMGPTCASKISECQEIVDHVKGSPLAWAQVRGDLPGRNSDYGLPDQLYGIETVVEDAVKVTSRRGATKATTFVCDDDKPVLLARPGGLMGVEGSPSFSALTLFMKEEMTVEQLDEPKHRRLACSVVEHYDCVLTAPAAAFLFTDALT